MVEDAKANHRVNTDTANTPEVAYFSIEVALEHEMPTYASTLGILAGDTLAAASDLGIPMVAVTLLYRKGYFRQRLDAVGNQSETPADWIPENHLEPMPVRVSVAIEGRQVQIRSWRHTLVGISGHVVPVYFLDTAIPENASSDQALTDHLYGRDEEYRLCQEAVLGLGGVAMLSALGHKNVRVYHMNEGHSALLAIALLRDLTGDTGIRNPANAHIDQVRRRCVYTTHTPAPAGLERFPVALASRVLGADIVSALDASCSLADGFLNMAALALTFSHYVNGVSTRHESQAYHMFKNYAINSISNGVHAVNWTSPPFKGLFDRYMPEWRWDNLYLRSAVNLPLDEIAQAHQHAKKQLLAEVKARTGKTLDVNAATIGFARRATAYKRPDLVLDDPDRLENITRRVGPLQIIYAGKAHPDDNEGKALIRSIFRVAEALKDTVAIVYLEEYDLRLARCLCSGSDLWLNTVQKSLEPSGISGMKAALNGVPCLSILDGWWVEGHIEGATGWAIQGAPELGDSRESEAASLYDKLESSILPMFYNQPSAFNEVRRCAIAFNGSYFNAHRMVMQYLQNSYICSDATWSPRYPHEFDNQ